MNMISLLSSSSSLLLKSTIQQPNVCDVNLVYDVKHTLLLGPRVKEENNLEREFLLLEYQIYGSGVGVVF